VDTDCLIQWSDPIRYPQKGPEGPFFIERDHLFLEKSLSEKACG
jgi:hypothetical protein